MAKKPKILLQFPLLAVFALALAPRAIASAKADTKGSGAFNPTFFLDITGGFTTYKSEMIVQNDTSTHLTYSIGGFAGAQRQYGFYVKTDANTTAFEINSSSVQMTFRDTGIRYRLGYVYLGVVFSQLDILSNNAGTDSLDASAGGTGGNFGVQIPMAKAGTFYIDATSVSFQNPRNALTDEVTFGARTDIDLGAGLDISKKAFDFLLGYRIRTFAINAAGTSGTESISTTYIGLRTAAFF